MSEAGDNPAEAQAEPNEANEVDPDQLTEQQSQHYEKILANIDKMHHKLHKVRENLNNDDHNTKVNEVHQIAETLLQAKENSEIVQKEDLGQDVTKTLEQNIVEIYSKNQLMRKKIEEMAKTIVEKNKKISTLQQKYDNEAARNKQLQKQIEILKKGYVQPQPEKQSNSPVEKTKKPKQQNLQTDDYDFWNAQPNDNLKKKKDIIANDSGLWLNQQKGGTFVTQQKR